MKYILIQVTIYNNIIFIYGQLYLKGVHIKLCLWNIIDDPKNFTLAIYGKNCVKISNPSHDATESVQFVFKKRAFFTFFFLILKSQKSDKASKKPTGI